MLQVAVHDDHHVAAALLDARVERGALAGVAREEHAAEFRVMGTQAAHDLLGAVGGAVAHHDDLVRPADRPQCRVRAPHELADALLLVVHGRHHRDRGRVAAHGATFSLPFIMRQWPGYVHTYW